MEKEIWVRRSPEWIKENPKGGTMYKVKVGGDEPTPNTASNYVKRTYNKLKNKTDKGIYAIICEPSKHVYVGQSIRVNTRIRSHRYKLINQHTNCVKTYKKMREDFLIHGLDGFQFIKCKDMPDALTEDLINSERETMFEFLEKGYKLYNYQIEVYNIYCPLKIKDTIQKIIDFYEINTEIIDKIETILTPQNKL